MSSRVPATWDDLLSGEFADELLAEVERAMNKARAEGKRMEVEGRAHPDGEKDGQAFLENFDVLSQPPTPANIVVSTLINRYRRVLGEDFLGRIRMNMRQKGNTRNTYGVFSKNIVPSPDEDDEEDFDGDFDDDGMPDATAHHHGHVPHIPVHAHGGPHQPGNPYAQQAHGGVPAWSNPRGNFPAVDMSGSAHFGPSAYERRRLAAREVGLNEPLSEFLMAPQWEAVTNLLGSHNDRLMRANLDMAGILRDALGQVVDANTQVTLRILDNQAPTHSMQIDHQERQANSALSVGMKLMKMMQTGGKKKKAPEQLAPSPPAWGSPSGEAAGDWSRPTLKVPDVSNEFDDGDDFDDPPAKVAAPTPAPVAPTGGGAGALPPTTPPPQLTAEGWSEHIRALAKSDPEAAKGLIIGVKDDVAAALDIDPDLLDAFLEDED